MASKRSHTRRSQAGFTLIELLAALAILAILGTMVASAMVTGSRVMAQTTTASNASVLEQSINTALSSVLRYSSAQVPSATQVTTIVDPAINNDSYTDSSGAAVRNGHIRVVDGHLALETSTGNQSIPKATGIYTDFLITDFQLNYDTEENLYTASFNICNQDGSYVRPCEFACRSLVESQVE